MSRHTSKAGKLCHGKVTQLGTSPWWTAGNVNSPITCFERPDNNAYPKTKLHKALIKMFNPLPSLQMAWADNKLTNSFWYIIHDLFSFSGNLLFFSKRKTKKKNSTKNKNRPKSPNQLRGKKKQLLQNNLESKTLSTSFTAHMLDVKHYNMGNVWQVLCRDQSTWLTLGESGKQGCACSVLVSKGPQATGYRVCIPKFCWHAELPGQQLLTATQSNNPLATW